MNRGIRRGSLREAGAAGTRAQIITYRENDNMRRIAAILLLGCLCLSLPGCGSAPKNAAGSGETGQNTEQDAAGSGETDQNTEPETAGEPLRTEDIVGDWSGNALLSFNSDHTWALNHNDAWFIGTWETAPDQEDRINLPVQYSDGTSEEGSYFEKRSEGYRLHLIAADYDSDIYTVSKMESEPPEGLFGNWHGVVELSEFDLAYKIHLSIDPDNTWTSVLSEEGHYIESNMQGAGFAGKIRYISEAGHLAVFDPFQGGVTKKSSSAIRYTDSVYIDHWGNVPLHFTLEPDTKR